LGQKGKTTFLVLFLAATKKIGQKIALPSNHILPNCLPCGKAKAINPAAALIIL
jgi:hypothetical protein